MTDEEFAGRIRQAYIDQYQRHKLIMTGVRCLYKSSPRWDGGTDSYGAKHQPIWPKIVQHLRKNGVSDADGFVDAQFDLPPGHNPPTPNTFMSPKSLERYRGHQPHLEMQIKISYEAELSEASRVYQTSLSLYKNHRRAMQAVILSNGTALSALFRHCLALKEELYTEAAMWYESAVDQYKTARGIYDQVWGDFIPLGGVELTTQECEYA